MLFASKILPIVIFPLTLVLGLLAAALLLSFFGRTSLLRLVLVMVFISLWVLSTPALRNWAYAELELRHPPIALSGLPEADAIVVLGGFLRQPLPPRTSFDLTEGSDRFLQALRLYRAGKAPSIIISGGNLPWLAAVSSEGKLISDLLVELGVSPEAIILDQASRNTRENAVNTAEIMRSQLFRNALLVTSGTHMPRAMAAFRKVGVDVTPATTDILTQYPTYSGFQDLLPNAHALADLTDVFREHLGLIVYRFRGWA